MKLSIWILLLDAFFFVTPFVLYSITHQVSSVRRVTNPPFQPQILQSSPDRPNRLEGIHFIDENPIQMKGSVCRRRYDNSEGHCESAKNCLRVMQEYRSFRIPIDICSFEGIVPIVCCPYEKMPSTPVERPRISVQKCEEFVKIISKRIKIFPLVFNPTQQEVFVPQCTNNVPLIVGGENTKVGEYPHMAAIGWRRVDGKIEWLCGGSLVSENFILTAAHCTHANGVPPRFIRLGDQNLVNDEDNAQPIDIEIDEIIRHPAYNTSSYYNDIALIKLKRTPNLNKFIRPACLWHYEEFNFTVAVATGWGKMEFAGKKSNELQKVGLGIINTTLCSTFYHNERKLSHGIDDGQFCAGYLEGGRDTCQGDSGGPIQVTAKDNACLHYIIGVTSFGRFCAAPNSPGVYTKVSHYIDWIEKVAFEKNSFV